MAPGQVPMKCSFGESNAAGDTIFTKSDILSSNHFAQLGKTETVNYNLDCHIKIMNIQFF